MLDFVFGIYRVFFNQLCNAALQEIGYSMGPLIQSFSMLTDVLLSILPLLRVSRICNYKKSNKFAVFSGRLVTVFRLWQWRCCCVLFRRGFLRSDKPIGTAHIKLDKLETQSEIREIVEVSSSSHPNTAWWRQTRRDAPAVWLLLADVML